MPANYEFESHICFDVNAYLIEAYPKMSLADRRAISSVAISEIDIAQLLQSEVDAIVGGYAIDKLKFINSDD